MVLLGACSRWKTVKTGVVASMTGPSADLGKDIVNGARIAVDELNADQFRIDGGRAKFELVNEDGKASKEEDKTATKKLVNAGVGAVAGHLNSHVSIAAASIYANA